MTALVVFRGRERWRRLVVCVNHSFAVLFQLLIPFDLLLFPLPNAIEKSRQAGSQRDRQTDSSVDRVDVSQGSHKH